MISILIAMDVAAMVAEIGCIPVGPASSVSGGGQDIVRNSAFDGAVLDINLGNERVWPVAKLLDQRGIPFALATASFSKSRR